MKEMAPVVITGASSGIGRACALLLDGRGMQVFAGVRRPEAADALRAAASARLTPVMLDVTDPDQIAAAADTIRAAVGEAGLGGLVNNAGYASVGPLELLDLDELRRQFEVGVFGQLAVTQAMLPMLRAARGRVVNMGTITARAPLPVMGPYVMAKAALDAFNATLRRELSPWGMHVSLIEPGVIATPIWSKSMTWAQGRRAALPAEAEALYAPLMDKAEADFHTMLARAVPPGVVAQYVFHALTARRPHARYVVGPDARLLAVLNALLPDRLMDWVVRWLQA